MSTLDVVRSDLISGDFKLTLHARLRMDQRGVTIHDIRTCARDGEFTCDGDKFKLVGLDTHDLELTVVCAYSHGTLIVTVM